MERQAFVNIYWWIWNYAREWQNCTFITGKANEAVEAIALHLGPPKKNEAYPKIYRIRGSRS